MDARECVFGLGQCALSGFGDLAGLFGGVDVGDAEVELASVSGSVTCQSRNAPGNAGALSGGQPLLAAGDVVERLVARRGRPRSRNFAEPGAGPQRNDEAQPGIGRSGRASWGARRRSRRPAGPGRGRPASRRPAPAPSSASSARCRGPDASRAGTPSRRAGLQRPHLPRDRAVDAPALGDQRGVLVGAGHPDRGQIDMQAADSTPKRSIARRHRCRGSSRRDRRTPPARGRGGRR